MCIGRHVGPAAEALVVWHTLLALPQLQAVKAL